MCRNGHFSPVFPHQSGRVTLFEVPWRWFRGAWATWWGRVALPNSQATAALESQTHASNQARKPYLAPGHHALMFLAAAFCGLRKVRFGSCAASTSRD